MKVVNCLLVMIRIGINIHVIPSFLYKKGTAYGKQFLLKHIFLFVICLFVLLLVLRNSGLQYSRQIPPKEYFSVFL